ncbi:hypothetical protein A1Q2_04526 [Trichosporon asahii var. asahii CBS 8904]|uniref:Extracellular membrane protein CFEM domain-containing protein n=2 Tax=Trichosporon asahii var. asahii TaxID=189963 RepID=K1VWN2_TRIAC|nr:hypothetical protein A1Q1_00634 [Trichosporon asahii var. asahii CBS 2479]EJT50167.1 hypothetical protein A1Q1_00634 [Trichosporon asahii var. asahii CBS 2479]EKD01203.1 hypothetical protein A1Q2_04526 [Trichosporon asahii var. asahii CBS 8904]
MFKSLALVSVLALTASADLFNLKQIHDVSEKCHDHCGEVGNVISNNCTSLFKGCLTEFCKAASVKPCLECLKTEKMYDKFESVCDFFGKDTNTSSSSSAGPSATSSSAVSAASAKEDKKDNGASFAAPAVGVAAVAAAAVAAVL